MSEIQNLVNLYNDIGEVEKKYMQLLWTSYTAGFDFGIKETFEVMNKIYKDKKNYDLICNLREKNLSADNKRRVEIAYNTFRPYHLSDEINELDKKIFEQKTKLSKILNTHRSTIDGKEYSAVEISNILNTCDDPSLRKKAFTSKSQVNRSLVDGGFLELLKLRKEYAKAYGANNFVEMSLEQQELSYGIFKTWESESKKTLSKRLDVKAKFAKEYLNSEQVEPWDEAYLNSQICPLSNTDVDMINFEKYIEAHYRKFGLSLNDKNIIFDVFPRTGKSEWGYQFTIELGKDSRILANIDNKFYNFNVLLHEAGHGIHYSSINPKDRVMNGGISGIISEGIANLFGYMFEDEIFYAQFFKDKLKEAKSQFLAKKELSKVSSLQPVESILFDHSLYLEDLNSLDDINQLKWKYQKDFNGYDNYGGEPNWAYLIHHTTHPIYLHNYFMGDVTSEMLKQVFCKRNNIDSINEKSQLFGHFLLDEVISPSGRYTFEELFKKISGENFNLKFLTS